MAVCRIVSLHLSCISQQAFTFCIGPSSGVRTTGNYSFRKSFTLHIETGYNGEYKSGISYVVYRICKESVASTEKLVREIERKPFYESETLSHPFNTRVKNFHFTKRASVFGDESEMKAEQREGAMRETQSTEKQKVSSVPHASSLTSILPLTHITQPPPGRTLHSFHPWFLYD
ncbi:hypothetical protein KQX54_000591 [Cotesia glomerata]|uniref:Uncharacterized protein n=1 Tax=Cotesia glomerata TaxID=32391 RepID=A0AAV7J2F7_COTGL|nr:hypothetical protein KQX54_000591 [Cotesia glomerata]